MGPFHRESALTPDASDGAELVARSPRWSRWIGPAAGAVIFAIALYALREEFGTYNVRQVRETIRALGTAVLVRATLIAVAAYAVLITYDILALRYIKHHLPTRRVAFISFIAFSFSNALGFPLLLAEGCDTGCTMRRDSRVRKSPSPSHSTR